MLSPGSSETLRDALTEAVVGEGEVRGLGELGLHYLLINDVTLEWDQGRDRLY